ncbi:hypothetical protein ABH920_002638 [Catenulispora sp. EB89]|uniref:hypothetical protein n=1 Tax=Catenulispora sp. EB89 TaxID=3156257 RepID=UPI0035128C1C
MPYDAERASRIGHVPIAMSPAIIAAMSRWITPAIDVDEPAHITSRLVAVDDIPRDQRPETTFTIAFDGSNQEDVARVGFPSIRVGYLQIAGVYVSIAQFLGASRTGLVNARELERSQITQTVNAVLPGSNVHLPGMKGKESWRAELDRAYSESSISDFGSPFTLSDALMTIHGGPGRPASSVRLSKCPTCGSSGTPQQTVDLKGGTCTEPLCSAALYTTDVLRAYEEFSEDGENIRPLNVSMNLAERLLLVAYIDGFFRAQPQNLGQGLFITDGPLAVYGPTAPLKSRFLEYWSQLCATLESLNLAVPLLVGIEKTGEFVDHAQAIADHIPNGYVMALDVPYINKYIVNHDEDHHYGRDEFYGRRFIFKTSTGDVLVITVPRVPGGVPYEKPRFQANGDAIPGPSDSLNSYPTLRATLDVLDQLQTRLYPNAVIPVALAHSASSLPLGTGQSVLTLLAQRGLGMPEDSISLSRLKAPRRPGGR